MTRKTRVTLGIIVLGAALVYLIFVGFNSSAVYYLTVDEVISRSNEFYGKSVKVNGRIVGESIEWEPEQFRLRFDITDGNKVLKVEYEGAKPDNFEHGKDVIVEGTLEPGGLFRADQLLVKCPSKYEPETPPE